MLRATRGIQISFHSRCVAIYTSTIAGVLRRCNKLWVGITAMPRLVVPLDERWDATVARILLHYYPGLHHDTTRV